MRARTDEPDALFCLYGREQLAAQHGLLADCDDDAAGRQLDARVLRLRARRQEHEDLDIRL